MRWILATISKPSTSKPRTEETQPYMNLKKLKAEAKKTETEKILLLRKGEGEEAGFFFSANGERFPASSVTKLKEMPEQLGYILTLYLQRGFKNALQQNERGCIQSYLRERSGGGHGRG